jgi:hypothetical protein
MSLKLPASDSPIRELFDVGHLADVASPANRRNLPTLAQARRQAIQIFKAGAAKSATFIVLRMNGTIGLVQFGNRGGVRHVWNFGGAA